MEEARKRASGSGNLSAHTWTLTMNNCPENCINCLMDHDTRELAEPWTDLPDYNELGEPSE